MVHYGMSRPKVWNMPQLQCRLNPFGQYPPYLGSCWLSPPKGPGGSGTTVALPEGSATVSINDKCEAQLDQKMLMGLSTLYATLAKDKKSWVGYWTNGGGTDRAPDYGVTNGVKR